MAQPDMRYLDTLDAPALADCLGGWHDASPGGGVLALLPEAEKDKLPQLQAAARQAGVPLVGAIFPALVIEGAFRTTGVALLRFAQMPQVALLADLNAGAVPAAEKIVSALRDHLPPSQGTLFMVFDGMVPNIASILEGVYLGLANRVHYLGVNAGSETFQPMPCLFDSTQVIGNGVLCLLLPAHPGAVLEHGYVAPDELVTATATEGNRILSIDWRPAFDVYRERVHAHYGIEVTRDNFYQLGVHFPFGILLANNDVLVRIPVALQEDGSLFCVGEIPANAVLTLLQSPTVDSRHTIERLSAELGELDRQSRNSLLAFYCAGRRLHLGAGAADELDLLRQRLDTDCMFGALSLGEIGSTRHWGYPQFHNAALVLAPWSCG